MNEPAGVLSDAANRGEPDVPIHGQPTTPAPEAALPGAETAATSTRRRAHAVVVVILILAALGLGSFVAHAPDPVGVRTVDAALGETVVVEGMQVRVDAVSRTDVVRVTRYDRTEEFTTAGTWLVVRLAYAPVAEPGSVYDIAWQDAAGRAYRPDFRLDNIRQETSPGQWWTVDLVLEVPPDAVGDGLVVVSVESWTGDYPVHVAAVGVPAAAIAHVEDGIDLLPGGWDALRTPEPAS